MPNTVLGRVKPIPKGEWSNSTAYTELDIVSHDGSSYIALQDVPSGTALSNTSYWECIVEKGDKGDTGEITGATASISGGYGTPSVSVTSGGTSTDRSFAFAFSNLVGDGIDDISVSKTGTSGNVDTYTMTITMDSGDTETVTWTVTNGSVTSVNGRTGAVTGLAEQDGYYEDMSVGSAEQLISSTYVSDSVPYVFRTSGGSADIGDRDFEDAIVGGTVAWNQLVVNGDFSDGATGWRAQNDSSTLTVANGVASVALGGTASLYNPGLGFVNPVKSIIGHKYFVDFIGKAPVTSSFYWRSSAIGNQAIPTNADTWTEWTRIMNATADNQDVCGYIGLWSYSLLETGDSIQFKRVMIIDLTAMFGSTIADYIYSLEQSEAGKGVAWFKALGFNKPYYAYNAGSLIHVNASAHNTIGFNQWDEVWESGVYGALDGQPIVNANRIRSKNAIPVVPNTTYYIKLPSAYGKANVLYYDANDGFIGATQNILNATFTTPSNCYYIRWNNATNNISTYNHDICINLHWDGERDGEYEPYIKHEYALDSSLTLRGIPKLDANNKLYYDGDEYANDGTVNRRYGIVDLGTLDWTYLSNSGSNPFFYTSLNDAKTYADGTIPHIISSMYSARATVGGRSAFGNNASNLEITMKTISTEVYIRNDSYTNDTTFESAMSGVYLVYELATPTTESADAFTSPQIIDDFGTEEFVVTEQSGVAMPVGHISRYTNNLRAKLEMAPESPSSGNGDYIVRQTNGVNTYVPLTDKIPDAPTSADGTFVLKATVSGGTATLSWVEET